MKQPDKLFKDKLYHHSEPVPSQAWNKIQAQMPAKKWNWLAIAAAILPFFIAAIYFVSIQNFSETQNSIASVESPVITEKKIINKNKKQNEAKTSKDNIQKNNKTKEVKDDKANKKIIIPPQTIHKQKESWVAENKMATTKEEEKNMDVVASVSEKEVVEEKAKILNQDKSKINASTTLVYTIAEVNEKYILKKEETEATTNNENASSFQKLLQKAGELTTNQSPIAQLRQKKNEILALDFKKEKSESKN